MNENTGSKVQQIQQDEWIGIKPGGRVRWAVAIATASAILTVVLYGVVERALGAQSTAGGVVIGIFSGLLTSGIIAGLAWFAYDYFLPMQRHKNFRPKIGGAWFAYFSEDREGGLSTEFVYMKQTADRVSGTITSYQNVIYDFVGQIVLGILVLIWVSHGEENDITGAIVLRPVTPSLWTGLQVSGYVSRVSSTPYVMTKGPVKDEVLKKWFGASEKDSELEGTPQGVDTAEPSDDA